MKSPDHFIPCLLVCITLSGYAQSQPDQSVAPRTYWDQPDLQGVWNFSSDIPMERPERFGNQRYLTEAQVEEQRARIEAARARAEQAALSPIDDGAPPVTDVVIAGYNDFWMERAGLSDTILTSHIVYPENGRLPQPVPGAIRQYGGLGLDSPGSRPVRFVVGGIGVNGPEDRGLSERCLVGFNSGPPFTPSLYNNNVQIIQSRDTVAIVTENIHDARILPLDGRPFADDRIRLWSGDSRGHWEGDTLVVETRNFNGLRQSLGTLDISFGNPNDNYSYGHNYDAVLTERFTRVDADTLNYEFIVDDPATWSDRVEALIPMVKTSGLIYEYACHEGNYGMLNILRGARAAERSE